MNFSTPPPMRRAIIHIGLHKTGTTSFQGLLGAHQEFLNSAGIKLMRDDKEGHAIGLAHLTVRPTVKYLGRIINPQWNSAQAKIQMRNSIAELMKGDSETILASHEALSLIRTNKEAKKLRLQLADREPLIVVVLRDKKDYLRSMKNMLKPGSSFISRNNPWSFMYTRKFSWLTHWGILLKVYRRTFGEENVRVISYEEAITRDGTVLKELWKQCELPGDAPLAAENIWLHDSREAGYW